VLNPKKDFQPLMVEVIYIILWCVSAFLGLLRAVEMGTQGALLAPTEILAYQHRDTLMSLCDGMMLDTADGDTRPVTVEVLTSSVKRKDRKALLEELRVGEENESLL